MKNLRLVTDGNLQGATVVDDDGETIGRISEVLVTEEKVLTVVKVGDKNHPVTQEDLNDWRTVFENAVYDKDFKVFTNAPIEIKRYSAKDILSVSVDKEEDKNELES